MWTVSRTSTILRREIADVLKPHVKASDIACRYGGEEFAVIVSETDAKGACICTVGYERFAMVGFDIGMWVAYATAADHPEHLERMVVAEAIILGVSLSPPLLGSRRLSEARPIIGGIPLRRLGHLSSRNL